MNGLHGASLLQKMTNKSNLSDELVSKRDACKELKTKLEETKQISVSFTNALLHLKSSAALISQQKQSEEAKSFGRSLYQNVCNDTPFKQATSSINSKLSHIAQLKAKCVTLDNLGHNRNRYLRKRDDTKAKLLKKNKPNSSEYLRYCKEYEKANYDYNESEQELIAEYNFLLNDAKYNGICKNEYDMIHSWSRVIFTSCYDHHEQLKSLRALPNVEAATTQFLEQSKEYVKTQKLQRVQSQLQQQSSSGSGYNSAPTAQVSQVGYGDTGSSYNTSPSPRVSLPSNESLSRKEGSLGSVASSNSSLPSTYSHQSVESCHLPSAPPPPPPPPSSSLHREDSVKITESDYAIPQPQEEKAGQPSSEEYIYYEDMKNAGFLIVEKSENVDGKEMKWSEYINRETGDSYWLESTTFHVTESRPAIFCE